jgi:hypothetical protein
MRVRNIFLTMIGLLALVSVAPRVALAHQPYCESADLTASNPWQVPDSTVSYASFGN